MDYEGEWLVQRQALWVVPQELVEILTGEQSPKSPRSPWLMGADSMNSQEVFVFRLEECALEALLQVKHGTAICSCSLWALVTNLSLLFLLLLRPPFFVRSTTFTFLCPTLFPTFFSPTFLTISWWTHSCLSSIQRILQRVLEEEGLVGVVIVV